MTHCVTRAPAGLTQLLTARLVLYTHPPFSRIHPDISLWHLSASDTPTASPPSAPPSIATTSPSSTFSKRSSPRRRLYRRVRGVRGALLPSCVHPRTRCAISVKAGYPPRDLTLIPELPVSSLGLAAGEQIIVSETPGGGGSAPFQASAPQATPAAPAAATRAGAPSAAVMPPSSNGPVHVEMRDGSFFIHRVCIV